MNMRKRSQLEKQTIRNDEQDGRAEDDDQVDNKQIRWCWSGGFEKNNDDQDGAWAEDDHSSEWGAGDIHTSSLLNMLTNENL